MEPPRELQHGLLPIVEVVVEKEIVGKGRRTEEVQGRHPSLIELPLLRRPNSVNEVE